MLSAAVPELNPIEDVWQYRRANKLAITSSTATTISSTKPAPHGTSSRMTRIASITTRSWTMVNF
jgi:hypothetical protein